jgi:DNA-binding transcriptional regulator YhcF (GntR family)
MLILIMILHVDPELPTPPYEQVRSQIAALARDGVLTAGTRLPTVRQLAGDLGVAVNTVARAYRELESAGLVRTEGRHGTFVTHRAAGVPAEAERLAARYAEETQRLGVAPVQALGLVRAALGVTEAGAGPGISPGSPADD